MSQSVSLECALRLTTSGMDMLIEGIRELNLNYAKNQKMTNCEGKLEEVDLLITTNEGLNIGVKKDNDGGAIFVMEDEKNEEVLSTINKIRQKYSKIKILNEVKKKGYKSIKEEVLANGKIRLVVEKWQ